MEKDYYWMHTISDEVTKYAGKFLAVHEKIIGNQVFEKAYITPSITIFPISADGKIIFIKERRIHETPSIRWKPVTGFYETQYSFEENVNRELQEEIGKFSKNIQLLHQSEQSGTINLKSYFALAFDLSPSKLPNPDGEDVIEEIQSFSLDEILKRTLSGEFPQGMGGFALLKLYIDVDQGRMKLV